VGGAREAAHVDSDLGDDGLRSIAIHPGDALQVGHVIGVGLNRFGDPLIETGHGTIEILDVGEEFLEHGSVVGREAPLQGVRQAGALPSQRPFRQLGQHDGIPFAADQGTQHRLARGPEDIGDHHAQLDVGGLQEFVDAIGLTGALPDQRRPIASQIPKLADGLRRNKARAQEPMLQQPGNPFAVADVRLPAGHCFDVLRIHQDDLEVPLQDVEHRFPEDPRALHRDVGDALRGQTNPPTSAARPSSSQRCAPRCSVAPAALGAGHTPRQLPRAHRARNTARRAPPSRALPCAAARRWSLR
jgi:hypothetical protein